MQVAIVVICLAMTVSAADNKAEIETLLGSISEALIKKIAESVDIIPIRQAAKEAVQSVKPQLAQLSNLMNSPAAATQAVAEKLASSPELQEALTTNGISARSGVNVISIAKSFMRAILG